MEGFLVAHGAEVWSLVAAAIGTMVAQLLRLRPRLRYSVAHSSNLLFDNAPEQPAAGQVAVRNLLRTASITVGNGGLQAAKNVELTFAFKPPIFNVRPLGRFEEATGAMGQFTLAFTSLAPSEHIVCDIVSVNSDLPLLTSVRSDDCVGKLVPMEPQRVWPRWWIRLLQFLLLLGLTTLIYLGFVVYRSLSPMTAPTTPLLTHSAS